MNKLLITNKRTWIILLLFICSPAIHTNELNDTEKSRLKKVVIKFLSTYANDFDSIIRTEKIPEEFNKEFFYTKTFFPPPQFAIAVVENDFQIVHMEMKDKNLTNIKVVYKASGIALYNDQGYNDYNKDIYNFLKVSKIDNEWKISQTPFNFMVTRQGFLKYLQKHLYRKGKSILHERLKKEWGNLK
jgi:hypothetical protein